MMSMEVNGVTGVPMNSTVPVAPAVPVAHAVPVNPAMPVNPTPTVTVPTVIPVASPVNPGSTGYTNSAYLCLLANYQFPAVSPSARTQNKVFG